MKLVADMTDWHTPDKEDVAVTLAVARYAERRALERADKASSEHGCGCAYAIRALPSEYE